MTLRGSRFLFALALVLAPSGAEAGALRLVSSDKAGVTLEFTLPAHQTAQVTRPEGTFWTIAAPGLKGSVSEEGRPVLPAENALLGIPEGTIASVRVVSETASDWAELAGRELEPLGKQEWKPDGKTLTPIRTFYRDPSFDRAWPVATAELGASGTWRRQRVASVRVNPFRVDPVAKTVRVVTQATIRVDFVPVGTSSRRALDAETRPAPANDRWEGLYERGLLNYEQAKAFRVAPKRAVRQQVSLESFGLQGVPYDPLTEWSLQVDTTGVFQVTFAQLSAKGFPAGVPVAQLTLTRRAYAGGQTPPFVRVPVPIHVVESGGTAGTFDAQDAIVFYGQNFLDLLHPSDYRRRFGDAAVYYLGVDPAAGGARMTTANADLGFATPVRPASFPSYRKYERRFHFNYIPRDTCGTPYSWSDQFADVEFADSLTMWTPDVEPTGTVRFRSTWEPFTYNPYQHTIWARWKRPTDNLITPVATLSWVDKTVVTSDTTFAADRIASGTNRFEWRGFSFIASFPEGGPSGAALRNFEVTYSRRYRAFQNALAFNSGDATGEVEIEIDGFTAPAAPNVTVYDVTDSTAPRVIQALVRQTGTGVWAARFQDQVFAGAPRRYFAFLAPPVLRDGALLQVPRAYATPIWNPPGMPDIVIVTADAFRAEADRLADFRRSEGYEVLVAPLSEVWDAFDEGRRSDWAIRRMFSYAFANWDSRFAVLFGDGSDDDRGVTRDPSPSWIPVHLISGPVGTGAGQELSASEFWYINDLDDSTPMAPLCISQAVDPFPDMAIGRIPAGSVSQAQGLVDKLMNYETTDATAEWRNKVLMLPDDPYSGATFSGDPTAFYCFRYEEQVFERICDNLEDVIKVEGGYRDMNVEQFRLREKLLPLERPVPGDQNLCLPLSFQDEVARPYVRNYTSPQLLSDLGNGAMIFNFQGHGSAVQLAHERIWAAQGGDQSVDFMFNEGKPPFFLSFSCHVNQFSNIHEGGFGDALGEAMVVGPQNPPRPSAGAIASYASSNYELLPSDPAGVNHLNIWLFRALFVDPPHDQFQGQSGARVLLGEALTLGAVQGVSNAFGLERRAIETYNLIGDPVTRVETGAPRMFATANGLPVNSGTRFQPGAAGDSIAFVIDLVDESRIDDLTLTITGEGARPVDPSEWSTTPSYPDTLNGGAGRRYLLTWNARPGAKDQDLVVTAHDRNGLTTTFVLPLRLEMRLFAGGQAIGNGDIAPATGPYQIVISSPGQLSANEIGLTVDGIVPPDLVVTPAPTDSSRRLWTLSWTGNYQTGEHEALVTFPGGTVRRVSFLTSTEPRVALRRVYAFPTPFAGPPVTINFTLDADQPASVAFKVYSVSGSLVYQRFEEGVTPGYHQWVWDGRDDKSDDIANGTYLFQVIAQDARGLKSIERGRIARVR